MFAATPVVFFVLAALYLGTKDEWRIAWMKAAVITGLIVVALTEALSLVNLLSLPAVAAAWSAACVVGAGLVWRRRSELSERLRLVREVPMTPALLAAIFSTAAIAAATGVTASVAPPNTYDSMTYHMARVAHWAADGTVAFYPTNILRQLYQPPWSEYAVLQLQVLAGGDQYANLVQWSSMVSSVVAVSVIAQQLGAPRRGQVLASIAAATLPMGILQASSTQTDYTLTLWLACSVAMALRFVADPSLRAASWFASCLGLAMLTKGTAYLFAAPLVILLGCWMLARLRKQVLAPGLVMICIPLLINSGYYLRNQAVFHNPLGPPQEAALLVNGTFTPQAVVSNALRDAVLQFGTPSGSVNDRLTGAIAWAHSNVLHIGVNDPRTTSPGAAFKVNYFSFDEDYAGDPLHVLLGLAAVLAGIGYTLRRGPPLLGLYAGALVMAFVVFAAYLRWQPWINRLELPMLVLSAPLVGATLSRMSGAKVAGLVAGVLVVAAVPWVIDNQTRPLVGFAIPPTQRLLPPGATIFNTSRVDLYFVKRPELKAPYVDAIVRAEQAGCEEIGLWSGPDDWEYPLTVLAQRSVGHPRIDQVVVTNESASAARVGAKPCMLVALVRDQPATVDLDGVKFSRVSNQDSVGVYVP